METISIKTLQHVVMLLLDSNFEVRYGGRVYRLHKIENGPTWVNWLSQDDYYKFLNSGNAFPVGWNALVRLA